MNISTVNNSSISNSSYVSKTSNCERQIQALEKQKALITDQIYKMKNSNADQKIKEDNIKELQQQISTIDTQICSIKSEEMSHKDEVEKVKNKKNDTSQDVNYKSKNSKETVNEKNLTDVLSSISDISKMYSLKNHMKSQIKNLNYEMHSTKSGPTPFKIEQVGKLSENISKIDNQIDKKYKYIKTKIQKASDSDENIKSQESDYIDDKEKVEKESKVLKSEIKKLQFIDVKL